MDHLITGADYLARFKDFQLVGREPEMERLSSILVRKRSNSVLMIGPSGVGASAIILGLQVMKTDFEAPFDIVSKRLFWLDVDGMFSSGNNDEITKSFNAAITRLKSSIDPILIVEDGGDFYEACRNAGTSHFINLLNSAVKEGKIQVILEVADKDLAKILSWHSDFTEAYTTLDVTEPVGDALRKIVEKAAEKLSMFHGIVIDNSEDHKINAIEAAIELTMKYRVDNGLGVAQPTRTIALLDRALASYRLAAHKVPQAGTSDAVHHERQAKLRHHHTKQREAENMIIQLEAELDRQTIEQRDKSAQNHTSGFDAMMSNTTYDTPIMSRMREQLNIAKKSVEEHNSAFKAIAAEINASLKLTRNEVLNEFSRITGISSSKLGEDEMAILRRLEEVLKQHVFGQDHVLIQLSNAVKVSKVGRRNKQRPMASFLMMGPSGTGKTEVAKRLAEALQGDQKALLRFDMSEYMERHAVSKLIGAPPGYEGFEAGGILTNAMRTNRNRIILFDEIEKAHPDVFNLFLQILDDGRLTDNVGRVADFSESIIIMTTNIGQPHFLNVDIDFDTATNLAKVDLDEQYRPEFLNRFNGRQNIVCFNRLGLDSIERIVARELADLARAYVPSGVEVVVSDSDIRAFCAEQYDPRTGARGLPGVIVSQLEPQVTDAILNGIAGKFEFVYSDKKFVLS
jgi:ATP-dependent Clp protease ATP-binding subunit ClpB